MSKRPRRTRTTTRAHEITGRLEQLCKSYAAAPKDEQYAAVDIARDLQWPRPISDCEGGVQFQREGRGVQLRPACGWLGPDMKWERGLDDSGFVVDPTQADVQHAIRWLMGLEAEPLTPTKESHECERPGIKPMLRRAVERAKLVEQVGALETRIADLEARLAEMMAANLAQAEVIERVREVVASRRCSDHGCVWGHSGGMGTNGGCSVDKMSRHEQRRELRAIAAELCAALADVTERGADGDVPQGGAAEAVERVREWAIAPSATPRVAHSQRCERCGRGPSSITGRLVFACRGGFCRP